MLERLRRLNFRHLTETGAPSNTWRTYGLVIFWMAATFCWSILCGKDLNWDQLNYHFYAGYSLAADRLGTDFMAANIQSFLNPLAYVPFYWMVSQHWHSLLVSGVLSAFHALNIALAYWMVRTVLPEEPGRNFVALLGAALAFLSPIFLLEAGASFADITTSILVMAGVVGCLHADRFESGRLTTPLVAGTCIGAAAGLKLTNLIFIPAGALALLVMLGSNRARLRGTALFAAGVVAGIVITHGYWSWRLWEEFQNPVLPLLNSVFTSADYPQISHGHNRFQPQGWLDAILTPFRIAQLRSWIYVENVAPDLRFAALTLGAIATGIALLGQSARRRLTSVNKRGVAALFAFFLSAYCLWLYTSANGRYGIVVSLLCGPLLAILCYVSLRTVSAACAALLGLTLVQIVHLHNGDLRWHTGSWTRDWYEVSVPDRLRNEPFLYVNVGMASNSYILPFLASGSVFTNPFGQVSIELSGPGGERLRRLIDSFAGRTRVIARAQAVENGHSASLTQWAFGVNAMLSRLELQVDTTDCLPISSRSNGQEPGSDFTEADSSIRRFQACRAVPRPAQSTETAERERITELFVKISSWCPKLFQPSYTVVERVPEGWFSTYTDTDITLHLEGNRVFVTEVRAAANLDLGTVDDWQNPSPPFACERMPSKLRTAFRFK